MTKVAIPDYTDQYYGSVCPFEEIRAQYLTSAVLYRPGARQ